MIHNINSSRKKISGITTVSMSIAMVVAGMLTLASARYAINKFNEDKGTLIGNQLQTMVDAVNAYITDNSSEILKVATPPSLTVEQLKILEYLGPNFNTTPVYGGSYEIIIAKITPPCNLNCITGAVYLKNPVGVVNSTTVDIRILGAAMSASKTGQIGYSMPSSKDKITGPNWQIKTPDNAKRAGILYATTSVLSNTEKHWLAPTAVKALLPTNGNITGDVRVAMDTQKPFMWNGTGWSELFSSDQIKRTLSIGQDSGPTTSSDNTYIGYHAGMGIDTINSANKNSINIGNKNTMIGASSGAFNTDGSNNIFMGYVAGNKNTTGDENLFLGNYAGFWHTNQSNNIILGARTAYTGAAPVMDATSSNNIYIGKNSGYKATSRDNIFIGTSTGMSAAGHKNIFIGSSTGINSTTGQNNTFLGSDVATQNTEGSFNVFTGSQSGQKNTSGSNSTYTGFGAGFTNSTGNNNTFNGYKAGFNSTGNNNTHLGHKIGVYDPSTMSTTDTGNANSFIGAGSGLRNATGSENSFTGTYSGRKNTTGNFNSFFGYEAGLENLTGNYNTFIGHAAGVVIGSTVTNATAIGAGARVITDNTVRIGNDLVTQVDIGNANLKTTGSITTSNIICPTCTPLPTGSDKRLKDHITDTPRDLSFIKKLRPVDYTLISNGQPQTGFIAQEVESADPDFPGIVKPQNDRDFYALTYTAFIPAIVKSIQQLDARLDKIAPATLATSATAPASVSGLANGATPAPASADLSLLKWLVLFLSVCVLSCLAVIVRFYKELQAMRLSVQRLHTLAG